MRLLQEQDIATAAALSAEAGWNQTLEDWRMLLRLNPQGCFGIDCDGRLVSTATLVCYGAQLGWIGMVLTNSNYRRRGFARTLLLYAIRQADQLGIESLKLDATDQGRPLYESLGFRIEQPVERWKCGDKLRISARRNPAGNARDPHCGNFVACHHFSSADLDLEAYGTDRSQMLDALAKRGGVCTDDAGFCFSRPGQRANYIGPCIARSPESARSLIQCCATPESYWDLLPQNQTALTIAIELGFTPQRKLTRMVRGRDLRGREAWIYAIAGFELG